MDKLARPVGPEVNYGGADRPDGRSLQGRYVRLERIDPARHGPKMWSHVSEAPEVWDYLFVPPPTDEAAFLEVLTEEVAKDGWFGYAILLPGDEVVGYAYYLNIVPGMGSIEVGNINFSPKLQRTPAATEAMFLMMQEAFRLGYRRYEWKCNALNAPSWRAAQRLGFSWEGVFRQHMVVKQRNRDTAWFAATDGDWPALKVAFETWLAPENFDRAGRQQQSLSALTAPIRVAGDPDLT